MGARIECPISWCRGGHLSHGGDGAPPEEWEHFSGARDLGHGLALSRIQVGSELPRWHLTRADGEELLSGHAEYVTGELRALAARIERLTVTL